MIKLESILEEVFESNLKFLIDIAEINTHSYNKPNVDLVRSMVKDRFINEFSFYEASEIPISAHKVFDEKGGVREYELADSLFLKDNRDIDNPIRLLWMIHLDTVFLPESPFQKTKLIEKNTLNGPGVADAKGGVVLIFEALQALIQSHLKEYFLIDIFFNTDEEIGSPGSFQVIDSMKGRYDYAMVFEPSLPDGSFISERKGNGNFQLKITGKASHAGREFDKGISAMHAAAFFIHKLNQKLNTGEGITFNVGKIDGGGPVNVVADLSVVRFNIRVETKERMNEAKAAIERGVQSIEREFGVNTEMLGGFSSPPKRWNDEMRYLFNELEKACSMLGIPYKVQSSGGVCDGNKLHHLGIPNIDTLGPVGGNIHSVEEYVHPKSLKERALLLLHILDLISKKD